MTAIVSNGNGVVLICVSRNTWSFGRWTGADHRRRVRTPLRVSRCSRARIVVPQWEGFVWGPQCTPPRQTSATPSHKTERMNAKNTAELCTVVLSLITLLLGPRMLLLVELIETIFQIKQTTTICVTLEAKVWQ